MDVEPLPKPRNPSPPSVTPPPPSRNIGDVDATNIEALEILLNNVSSEPSVLAERFHHYVSRLDGDSIEYISTTNVNSPNHVQLIPISTSIFAKYTIRMQAWRRTLRKGDQVDAGDGTTYENIKGLEHHFKWFKAKVVDIAPEQTTKKDYKGTHELKVGGVKLSYAGFPARYDAWLGFDNELVIPTGSFRTARKLMLQKRKEERDLKKLKEQDEAAAAAAAVATEEEKSENFVISRSGRKSSKKSVSKAHCKKVKKTKKKVEPDPEDNPSWICVVCTEAECDSNPDAPLLICEGTCQRTFHTPCVGLAAIPAGEWLCTECKTGKHTCAVCGEIGEDNVEGGVVKCSRQNCGLYYHESCVRNYNMEENEVQAKQMELARRKASEEGGEEPPYEPLKFVCPAHFCWTCGDVPKNERSTKCKKGELFRCLHCPISYHADCIPPLAKFHELAMICHEHSAAPLPALPSGASVLNKNHATKFKDDTTIPKVLTNFVGLEAFQDLPKHPGFTLPPMLLPKEGSELTPEEQHNLAFRIPMSIHDEVYQKPPKFAHLNSLKYPAGAKPPKNVPTDVCRCIPVSEGGNACDENCLNKMMYIECFGGEGDGKNKKNCNCGPDCGNRKLSNREITRTRPAREIGKGWGLIAVDDVKPGDLILEYVGEVLTEEQIQHRLQEHEKLHPNDPNFYIMELQNNWYIDARDKGSLSRFINHSCEPNCQLERINVGGYIRIAIMCIRPIKGGSFLSYDYQFDTKHASTFPCACGSKLCRGTMKGGKSELNQPAEDEVPKSRDLRLKEARAREEKDKVYIAKVESLRETRLTDVGLSVPGSTKGTEEQVLQGPQMKYKEAMRYGHIGLWRNAQKGYQGILEKGEGRGMPLR